MPTAGAGIITIQSENILMRVKYSPLRMVQKCHAGFALDSQAQQWFSSGSLCKADYRSHSYLLPDMSRVFTFALFLGLFTQAVLSQDTSLREVKRTFDNANVSVHGQFSLKYASLNVSVPPCADPGRHRSPVRP